MPVPSTTPDLTPTASHIVYENRWMRVREDETRHRDGSPGLYAVVEKPDFVMVAPIDAGLVHLVQQYRYPLGARCWEFPCGAREGEPDADPLELARAELREETGLTAGRLDEVGRLYPLPGTLSFCFRIFLATDLTPGPQALEPEEQGLITRAFSLADFEAMILSGEIADACTVSAFGLLRMKGLV